MTRVMCERCGGVYSPVQADGSVYIHVCPPPVERPAPAPARWDRLREWLRRQRGGQ